MLPDLRRILKNTEAREWRARDKRWGTSVKCDACGTTRRRPASQALIDKCELESELAFKQRSYIYDIEAWLWTLKAYNKGEPKPASNTVEITEA